MTTSAVAEPIEEEVPPGPYGKLDVTQDWNQPVAQPLFPPLPWHSRNGEHIVAVYETDLDPVLDLLPPDLEPAHEVPRVIAWLGGFGMCSGGGPYTECMPLLPVLFEGEVYNYVPWGYVGNDGCEEWFAAGREVWGHASKQANIHVQTTEGTGLLRAWCERPRGRSVVDVTVGPPEGLADEADLGLAPLLGLRVIPHPERDAPEKLQLVATEREVSIRRDPDGLPNLWRGQASVDIGRSEQDPWYRLPVRDVLGGFYASMNVVVGHGRILKSYV